MNGIVIGLWIRAAELSLSRNIALVVVSFLSNLECQRGTVKTNSKHLYICVKEFAPLIVVEIEQVWLVLVTNLEIESHDLISDIPCLPLTLARIRRSCVWNHSIFYNFIEHLNFILGRVRVLRVTRQHRRAADPRRVRVLRPNQPDQALHRRARQGEARRRGDPLLHEQQARELPKRAQVARRCGEPTRV